MLKKAIAMITTVFLVSSCNMNFVNNTTLESQNNIKLKGFSIKSTTDPNEIKKSFLPKIRISKGKEDESKKTFKFEATQSDLSRSFVLNIFNGADGTNRVANIEVKVNGKTIIFNHDEDLNDIEDVNKIKNKLCEHNEKDNDKKFDTKSEKDDDSVKIKDCSLLLQNFFNRKTESLSARMWGIKTGTNTLEVKVKEEKKKFAVDVSVDGFLDPINIANALHSKLGVSDFTRQLPTVKGRVNIKFLEGMKVRLQESNGKNKLVDLNGTSFSSLENIFKLFSVNTLSKAIGRLTTDELDNIEAKIETKLQKDVPNGNLFYRIGFDESTDVWSVVDEIKKLPYVEEAFPEFKYTQPSDTCSLPNDTYAQAKQIKPYQYDWLKTVRIMDNNDFIFEHTKYNKEDESLWGAWRYGRGNENIEVAILDSWFEHPDLGTYDDGKPILLHEDFDKNKIKFINNVKDKSQAELFIDGKLWKNKPVNVNNLYHGTGAAGIIGAKANNNKGVAGITDAKMLWVKSYQAEDPEKLIIYNDKCVNDNYGVADYNSFTDSMVLLAQKEYDSIKIILLERQIGIKGGIGSGEQLEKNPLIRYMSSVLINALGKVIVIPAGNDYETDVSKMQVEQYVIYDYKTLYERIEKIDVPVPDTGSIVVGGLNKAGGQLYKPNGSNRVYYNYGLTNFDENGQEIKSKYLIENGHGIDVSAIAENSVSTTGNPDSSSDFSTAIGPGNYFNFGGTSAASPIIAGICQLILSANPNLSPREVRRILRITTKEKNLGITTNGKKTAGMVNAYEAVKMAKGGIKPDTLCDRSSFTIKNSAGNDIPVVTYGSKTEMNADSQFAIQINPSIKDKLNNVFIGGIQLTLLEIVQNYAIYGIPEYNPETMTTIKNQILSLVFKDTSGNVILTIEEALKFAALAINLNPQYPAGSSILSQAPFLNDNVTNNSNRVIKVKQGDLVALSISGMSTTSPKSITVYEANYGNQFDIYKRDGDIVYFTVSLNAPLGLNSIVFYDNDSTSSEGLIFHNAIEILPADSTTTSGVGIFPSPVTSTVPIPFPTSVATGTPVF